MPKKNVSTCFILVVLAIFQLVSVNSIQAQSVYHNEKGHFSFSLPAGWKEDSQSDVDALSRNASKMTGTNIRYIAALTRPIKGGIIAINIQMNTSRKFPEKEIKQFANSAEQQAMVGNMTKTLIKNIPMDFGKYVYDEKRTILFKKNSMNAGGKNIVGIDAMIFSNYGYVYLNFNTTAENFDYASSDFNQIMNSFIFDEGYRY